MNTIEQLLLEKGSSGNGFYDSEVAPQCPPDLELDPVHIDIILQQDMPKEMANSYFGDAIICRDFPHAWLKESWVNYMPHCYLHDTHSADERNY